MSQCYTVTIQLPEDFSVEKCKEITAKYLEVIKKRKLCYIQAFESGEHKFHSHIAYLASEQKSTSNETRQFKDCYEFKKKDYPKAILHKQHDDWKYAVGYVTKDVEKYDTNLSDEKEIEKMKKYYDNKKEGKKKGKKDYITVNEVYELFKQEIEKNPKLRLHEVPEDEEDAYCAIRMFFVQIKDRLSGSTWQKLNFRKLIQFGRLHGLQGDWLRVKKMI